MKHGQAYYDNYTLMLTNQSIRNLMHYYYRLRITYYIEYQTIVDHALKKHTLI